jgi:hypothetical protein
MEAFTGFHRFADCIEGDLQRGCVRFEVMDVDSYRDALACPLALIMSDPGVLTGT